MRSPVSAIMWEIWRKNCWGFWLVLGLLAGGLLIRLFGRFSETAMAIGGISMGATFLVTFAIFSFAASSPQISFPARTFTLPIRTGLLVNCPLFFGTLTIAILHFAWAFLFLLPVGEHYPLGLFTIYWVTALMTFQAIVWCLADFPKSLVVVLISAMVLFVRLALLLVEESEAMRAVVYLLVILPVAYLCARVGIRQQRHGQWRFPAIAQTIVEITGNVPRRKRPFAAAAQAQLWMESRRNAVAPLISLGVGAALVWAGFLHLGSQDGLGFIAIAWFNIFCIFLALWAFTSSLLLARDAASRSLALSSFIATRPVTSGELAFAKIKLTALLTLAGWFVYFVGIFVWIKFCWQPGQSGTQREGALVPMIGFVALALAWQLVGGLSVWLAGRIESAAWAGLLLLGGYIALGNAFAFLEKYFGLLVALPWVFAVAFVVKMLLAVWAFRESCRQQLLSPRAAGKYVLFWLLGTICFVAIASVLCQGTIFPQSLVILTVALLLPLARVGLAPLALARARHR
ncbi:MAG: hypothetical protein ABI651_04085 [Verrucomicrobiota bacterium]